MARAPDPSAASLQDISKVTIFDPPNRFVAYSGPFKEGVREVMFLGDDVYVLANDGQVGSPIVMPSVLNIERVIALPPH